MLFNSIEFVFFFLIVTPLYFVTPYRWRWFLLLISSCYFYMSFVPVYILILAFTIIIDYLAGQFIEKSKGHKRKLFLIMSLVANIGVLAYFKYFNFLNDNLTLLLQRFDLKNPIPFLKMVLPIGLSFHTFQAMSYTIEVYRGHQRAEKHFGIYSLYVMFYPQLVAGPIERPQNLLPQFYEKNEFSYANVTEGLKLMVWGFYKKLVVADRIAIYVNSVYTTPRHQSGLTLLVATVLYAFQIYCDFSGYSDIAIGTAKIMGLDLMQNFKRPYFSKNVSEFWHRWHISLSKWFLDYFYISIGGNRVSIPRWYFNLFITFLISGLWHGANWTFIVWGALNGVYLIISTIVKRPLGIMIETLKLNRFPKAIAFFQMILTFFLITVAWIFFRANNISDALFILKEIFHFKGPLFFENPSVLIYPFIALGLLMFVEWNIEFNPSLTLRMKRSPWFFKCLIYVLIVIIILIMGVFDGGQFIYFQF